MKNYFLLLILMFSLKIYAQTNLEEVVYLKNGSIIRGTIIEQIPNDKIKIQTKDGNVFVYKYDEILKLTKEVPLGISSNAYKDDKSDLSSDIKKHKNKGIGLLTSGSALFVIGMPVMFLTRGGIISGPILIAGSIPMFAVGGVQIKKYKKASQSKVYFSPNIGIHNQVGIHITDKSKGMSFGASVKFTF